MTVNYYFESSYTADDADQELFADLIIESIQVHGRNMFYLPRTLTNFDSFFGEDSRSAFNTAVTVEFYLENIEGWDGDNKFLSKFGMEIRDEATLIVARKRFVEEVTSNFPDIKVPREGDVIVFPSTIDKRMRAFEVSYVDGESVFYQLGELFVWKLKVRNFEYNGETFDTGHPVIDSYEPEYSIGTSMELEEGFDDFIPGETIRQGVTWSATVISTIDQIITMYAVKGTFDSTASIVGDISGSVGVVIGVTDSAANTTSDNKYINEEDDEIVGFSESNPFSGL